MNDPCQTQFQVPDSGFPCSIPVASVLTEKSSSFTALNGACVLYLRLRTRENRDQCSLCSSFNYNCSPVSTDTTMRLRNSPSHRERHEDEKPSSPSTKSSGASNARTPFWAILVFGSNSILLSHIRQSSLLEIEQNVAETDANYEQGSIPI